MVKRHVAKHGMIGAASRDAYRFAVSEGMMIDWQRVAILREEVGEDGFALIVDLFLDEAEEAIAGLSNISPEGLEAALHFLKGSALNLGFTALAAFCAEGERRASASGGTGGEVDVTGVAALFQASRAEFLAAPLHGMPLRGAVG